MYDVAIIGAGINGASVAFEFLSQGKSVIIFDKGGIASGGSGSAGAFISPKFSNNGELKDLIFDAFLYSLEFYKKNFFDLITSTQLIHIAKDAKDANTLQEYKKQTSLKLYQTDIEMQNISIDSAIVDAKAMCEAMCSGAKFVKLEVQNISFDGEFWKIEKDYIAKNIVLATGAYNHLVDEKYLNIRGIWGHRIDIKTTTKNRYSLHQFVSISPDKDGVISIGATHNVHYHPDRNQEPYDLQKGRDELLQKASQTISLENVEVIKDYTGLRSGSSDYMPLVGSLVIADKTLELLGTKLMRKKQDFSTYLYHKNLYMINGNGGYGFVLAPYLAKQLTNHILKDKEIQTSIQPARFFARWARQL